MPHLDAHAVPLDPASSAALAAEGLRYESVPNEGPGFDEFLKAVARGFLDPVPTAEQIADSRDGLAQRRLTAVFDPESAAPASPVATIDSWVTELTTGPGRTVPSWAISGVTVAPTHRRRGIATATLTGELRAAAEAGFALSSLTVTEATIYGRWGFAPAASAADWSIDARRARWIGPVAPGRLDYVAQDDMAGILAELHDRTRTQRPGEVQGWPQLWRRQAGLRPGATEAAAVRAVAYRDGGAVQGVLVYTITEDPAEYRHTFAVRMLVAATDDAYAALWRFALEHDLITTVTASLQPLDAPLPWMIADARALTARVTDHQWLRVLDVPAALAARAYAATADLTVRVVDPLGIAEGVWRVGIDADGAIEVAPSIAEPDVTLPAASLAAMYLGGTRASALRAAGRVHGEDAAIRALDAAFAPELTPGLGIWY